MFPGNAARAIFVVCDTHDSYPVRGGSTIRYAGGALSRKKKTVTTGREASELEQARNDLFGHIHRCGVLRASEDQQVEWMNDTVEYLGECYPSLADGDLDDLKTIGLRFCRPVIDNAAPGGETAEDGDAVQDADGAGEEEIAASAA